jgi:diguanylate cyclase (GGDEF)-like protein/PAS domain S-box-containing protein
MAETEFGRGEILAVDDTLESLAYLCEILRHHGHVVRAAPGGDLALWSACSKPPDLVLLDVRMPGIDGFEVCRRLKADARTAQVPVIFLSALDDIDDKLQGFRAGGVDYIAKPFEPAEVLQRVRTHVRLAQLTRALEAERLALAQKVRERTAELEATNQRLRLVASAFEASFSGMAITDPQGTILAINPAFTRMTGYGRDECIDQNIRLLRASRHEAAYFKKMWQTLAEQGRWSGEIWNRRKDGTEKPQLLNIAAVPGTSGQDRYTHYVAAFSDLAEIREAQEVIDYLVHHDPLTGLPNRLIAQDRFSQWLAAGTTDEHISVVCINLDRFRLINDRHGYATGNAVLQWVSKAMNDLLPAGSTLFREGADEFVLIHRERKGLADTRQMVEAILACLNAGIPTGVATGVEDMAADVLSSSIGIATYPADGHSFETLIANASLALRRIKEKGGNACAYFSESLDQGMRTRFEIARHLHKALSQGEFEVYLQPQTSAQGARIVAAEALLRWKSAELGSVSPASFIPVAEETGDIVAIGAWVLDTVCEQIAAWRRDGLGDLRVAVNLSARQFTRHDICATVARALAHSGIPPTCLELEITESALIDDVQEAITTLQQLKQLGVSISLDDFGTGYSSLSYLKKFPIDYLKVDQSFVRDLIVDVDANAIVRSIIGLAHNMRMKVIAEGVETVEQMNFLIDQQCDMLQGYYLGRPMPVAQFRALIEVQTRQDRTE